MARPIPSVMGARVARLARLNCNRSHTMPRPSVATRFGVSLEFPKIATGFTVNYAVVAFRFTQTFLTATFEGGSCAAVPNFTKLEG